MRLGSELVNKRSRFTKHFPILDDAGKPIPRKFVADINSASQHYQDENKWEDIDLRLQNCSLTNWRWKIEKNNWSLLIGEGGKEGAIAAVNKADGIGIGWRPERVAYLNIVTKEWQVFKEAIYGTPNILVDEARQVHLKWTDVWPNVDVELKVWADGIKQNILFSQTARDNAPPIPDGWNAKDTYLVWIYEVDWKKIHRIEREDGSEIDKDEAEIDGRIIFKNALGKFSQMMPRIGAWVEGHEDKIVPIRRRLIKYQGKHYILEGCPVTKLNQLPQGTIIFDDNVTYTGAGDARVYHVDANYTTVHNAATGTSVASQSNTVGQRSEDSFAYHMWRLFMYFDTSGLPDGATIDAGTKIQLCCESDYSTTDFDVCVLKGTQGTTVEVEDYDAWDTETEGADRWNTVDYDDEQYIDLVLNATGRGWIDKTGNTFFCFRSLEDINSDPPIDYEAVKFRASNDADKEPKLYVVYSVGGVIHELTATCSVASSTTGSLTLGKIESLLATSATATNVPSTTLQLLYSITAHAPPTTSVSGSLTVPRIIFLSGTASIGSSTQGFLTQYKAVSALAEASSETLATLSVIFRCTAIINISTNILAELVLLIEKLEKPEGIWEKQDKPTDGAVKQERPTGVWEKQDRPSNGAVKQERPTGVWEKLSRP